MKLRRRRSRYFKADKISRIVKRLLSDCEGQKFKGSKRVTGIPLMMYEIHVQDEIDTCLDILAEKYGTDKGGTYLDKSKPFSWAPHSYCKYYLKLFQNLKKLPINLFECGIGTNNIQFLSNMTKDGIPGASLYMWREFFPVGYVYGVDIDSGILFQDDRIKTCQMDQTSNHSISMALASFENKIFDIVIDDGLHTYAAAKNLFQNLYKRLRSGGIYVIEDVSLSDVCMFARFFSSSRISFRIVDFYSDKKLRDDRLILINKP